MANEAEQAIYTGLRAAPLYHPVDVTLMPQDWSLEAGDIVTVTKDGDGYSVPLFSLDYTWKGAVIADAQSTGNQKRESLSALQKKYYGGYGGGGAWAAALADKKFDLIASKVEFENLKLGNKTLFQDTSTKISGEETRAKAAEKQNKDALDDLKAGSVTATALKSELLQANTTFNLKGSNVNIIQLSCGGTSLNVLSTANANVAFTHYHAFTMTQDQSTGVVTATIGTDQYNNPGPQSFDVAATAWFQQQMAAYRAAGYSDGYSEGQSSGYSSGWGAAADKVSFPTASTNTSTTIKYPPTTVGGSAIERALRIRASGNWAGGYQYIYVEPYKLDGTGWDSAIMRLRIDADSSATWSGSLTVNPPSAYASVTASCTVNGKTYTHTYTHNAS